MKNKNVGYLIIGFAIVIGIIILLFNQALSTIVDTSCTHGPTCPMYGTIHAQTYIGIALIGVIIAIGFFFIFTKENEKIIFRQKKFRKIKPDLSGLDSEEKKVVEILSRENGAVFQKTLMEELEIGKVGMTRLIDKLEAKQIVERKRRGMNNIVVLKK